MPALPPPRQLEALIEQELKERAPKMYQRLKASGMLHSVVKSREGAARESYHDVMSEVIYRASLASRNLNDSESVNEVCQGRSRAAEQAINQAVDFTAPEIVVAPIENEIVASPFFFSRGFRRPGI